MDGDVEDGFQELLASSVTDGMFQDSLSGSEDFEAESHADKEPTSDVARRENAHVTATLGDCEQAYSSVLSRIALNPNKAGLSLVDKDHVNKIIYETSKDSKFFQNEIKKDRQDKMLDQLADLRRRGVVDAPETLSAVTRAVAELEASRDCTRTIVHVDMDSFYAEVETLANPGLRERPMAVGGMGMLCTANYAARQYGVRSAMPGYIALKLCPSLVIVRPDFPKYRAASEQVRAVLCEYDPNLRMMSLDEAYLDITGCVATRGMRPADIVAEMRQRIHAATGLTASAGIAPNAMLAKVCSDMQKPNGQHALGSTRQEVLDFVRELPIRKVSGIGKVAEKVLGALGIHKCGDLYAQRAALHCLFSEGRFDFLMRVALGVGHGGDEDSDGRAKSISHERTFGEMSRRGELLAMCRELCEAVAGDLRRKQCRARTITLKIKTIAFEVSTRQVRLPAPADCPDILYARCAAMLRTLMADGTLRLRLMGVRASSLLYAGEAGLALSDGQKPITAFFAPASDTAHGANTGLCPVCGMGLHLSRDAEINAHIDDCLTKAALQREGIVDRPSAKAKLLVGERRHNRRPTTLERMLSLGPKHSGQLPDK